MNCYEHEKLGGTNDCIVCLRKEIKQLQAKVKAKDKHIKLLQLTDESNVKTISEMDKEIERLKKLLKYSYDLPMNEAGEYDENIAWEKKARQALEVKK